MPKSKNFAPVGGIMNRAGALSTGGVGGDVCVGGHAI
jgi:hypothetical protein